MHTPDNWVVVKLPQCYKVLAGWSGGYLDADEWRLNSGITGCHIDGDYYVFAGHSGSLYRCHKDSYGLRTNNAYIFNKFQNKFGEDNFKMMPEDTNWLEMDWGLESIESKLIDSGVYLMSIRYSTNYMGPINMDWIKEHGSDWAGGRIDMYATIHDMYGGDWSYPEEIGLPIMKADDYNKFSDWLETVETDDVWTLQQLVEQYEKTNSKIVWHRTPRWEMESE